MAHCDYECCALCDCKMGYVGGGGDDDTTKSALCSECLLWLQEKKIAVVTVAQLVSWIEVATQSDLEMIKPQFGFCYYANDVDAAMRKKLEGFGMDWRYPWGKEEGVKDE